MKGSCTRSVPLGILYFFVSSSHTCLVLYLKTKCIPLHFHFQSHKSLTLKNFCLNHYERKPGIFAFKLKFSSVASFHFPPLKHIKSKTQKCVPPHMSLQCFILKRPMGLFSVFIMTQISHAISSILHHRKLILHWRIRSCKTILKQIPFQTNAYTWILLRTHCFH